MQRFTSRTLVVHDEGHACALKIKFFPQISGKKFFSPDFRKKIFFPRFQEKKFFPRFQETQDLCSKSRQTKISSVQRSETLQRFCVYFEIHIIFFPELL